MNKSRSANPSTSQVSDSLDFSLGGGNMGDLLRKIDWLLSPLGPLESWPSSLRTTVSIMLNSGNPMFIAWGPTLAFLFNDAYLPILGEKGNIPAQAMGKPFPELWADVWEDVKPFVDAALSGQAIGFEDFRFVLQRNSSPEEAFFTFSYSPLRDETGQVAGIFCACIETTDKVVALRQLTNANEKLQLATDVAELGLFEHVFQSDIITMDWRALQFFGLPPEADFDMTIFEDAIHPEDRNRMRIHLSSLLKGEFGERYEAEYRTIGINDGKERWIAARGRMYFDDTGVPIRLIGSLMDISARKATEIHMKDAAQHDSLTGLPNRVLLYEYAEHILAAAERSNASCAVLFIDLDRFKPINDLYGHDIGDKVLQEVARRLLYCTRKEDIVSRIGGDEFIVVLPRIQASENPATLAQHILDMIGQPIHIDSLLLHVSPSIGISLFKKHANDLETLIRYADLAMYAAKKAGRNTYRYYMLGLDERASDLLRLEVKVRSSIASSALQLFYQPILDMQTGHLVGVEALIRIPSDNGVMLNPTDFIPVAETAGLINELGEWVLNEACQQHQRWLDVGLPPFSIAINVSPMQFRHKDFASQIAQAIKNSGIDPSCLQIEVTENAVIDNLDEAISTLNEIRAMGVRISLDDFGTGYSSLSYLSSLPLDKLKIDQTFVRRLDSHKPTQSITEAVIALGQSLNLKVVGEGIESQIAMEYLRQYGCDQAQGYWFSEPLSAASFEIWYRKRMLEYQ